MIELCLSYTFADRDKLIYYEETSGFKNTILKLEELYENTEYGFSDYNASGSR